MICAADGSEDSQSLSVISEIVLHTPFLSFCSVRFLTLRIFGSRPLSISCLRSFSVSFFHRIVLVQFCAQEYGFQLYSVSLQLVSWLYSLIFVDLGFQVKEDCSGTFVLVVLTDSTQFGDLALNSQVMQEWIDFRPIYCKTFVGVLVFSFRNPFNSYSKLFGLQNRNIYTFACSSVANYSRIRRFCFETVYFFLHFLHDLERFQNVLRAIGNFFVDVIEVRLHLLLLLFLQGLTVRFLVCVNVEDDVFLYWSQFSQSCL